MELWVKKTYTHTTTRTHTQYSRFYHMKLRKTKEIRAVRSSFRVLIGFITPRNCFPIILFKKKKTLIVLFHVTIESLRMENVQTDS